MEEHKIVSVKPKKTAKKDAYNVLGKVVSLLPTNIYWKDCDGIYLGCNDNTLRYFGLSNLDELIGKSDFDLQPDVAKIIHQIDQQVIKTGIPQFTEEPSKLDSNVTFLTQKVPLKDDNNNIIGINNDASSCIIYYFVATWRGYFCITGYNGTCIFRGAGVKVFDRFTNIVEF